MNPVKHSQKNWRFCLENSGGDLLGAGLDIDAQGHKQVAPSLEIGLEPGQNSPGTSAWNLPPGFLRVDGKGHFKFQNGAGLDGPPFAQRPTRKLARRCAPATAQNPDLEQPRLSGESLRLDKKRGAAAVIRVIKADQRGAR